MTVSRERPPAPAPAPQNIAPRRADGKNQRPAVHDLDVSAALAAQRTQQKAVGSGAMPNLRLILLDKKNDRPHHLHPRADRDDH